eukprot:2765367-Alexandrium_andersonii.AAC.1
MASYPLTPEERACLWTVRFEPTFIRPASDALIQNLPPGWKDAPAARLVCPADAVELLVVVELLGVDTAREYLAYQNKYIQTHGTARAVVPMLSARNTWTLKEAMKDYVESRVPAI